MKQNEKMATSSEETSEKNTQAVDDKAVENKAVKKKDSEDPQGEILEERWWGDAGPLVLESIAIINSNTAWIVVQVEEKTKSNELKQRLIPFLTSYKTIEGDTMIIETTKTATVSIICVLQKHNPVLHLISHQTSVILRRPK